MREDIQPSGLVSHHTAHDVVERFPFPRMGIVVVKQISLLTLRVLENAVSRIHRVFVAHLSQTLGRLEETRDFAS